MHLAAVDFFGTRVSAKGSHKDIRHFGEPPPHFKGSQDCFVAFPLNLIHYEDIFDDVT